MSGKTYYLRRRAQHRTWRNLDVVENSLIVKLDLVYHRARRSSSHRLYLDPCRLLGELMTFTEPSRAVLLLMEVKRRRCIPYCRAKSQHLPAVTLESLPISMTQNCCIQATFVLARTQANMPVDRSSASLSSSLRENFSPENQYSNM